MKNYIQFETELQKKIYGKLLNSRISIFTNKGGCYPSLDTLAEKFNTSKYYIQKALNEMEKQGIISWSQWYSKESGHKKRRYYFPCETKEYKHDVIINSGLKNLDAIRKKFELSDKELYFLGFKVDSHNHTVKEIDIPKKAA